VTLARNSAIPPISKLILYILHDVNRPLSKAELAIFIGLSERTIDRHLEHLLERRLAFIAKVGHRVVVTVDPLVNPDDKSDNLVNPDDKSDNLVNPDEVGDIDWNRFAKELETAAKEDGGEDSVEDHPAPIPKRPPPAKSMTQEVLRRNKDQRSKSLNGFKYSLLPEPAAQRSRVILPPKGEEYSQIRSIRKKIN
jgi:sugar phosphate isomerase/epimerase